MGKIKSAYVKKSNKKEYMSSYGPGAPGMEYIRNINRATVQHIIKPKTFNVGIFGIVDKDGLPHMYTWRVDGWRKDRDEMLRRDDKEKASTMSDWAQRQFNDMFRGW